MKETIYTRLLEVQKEIKGIKKDSENPFFKSKYFDINSLLAEVKPILNKHGLILLQPLTTTHEGKLALRTILVSKERFSKRITEGDEEESEDIISFVCPVPENADAQKQGSAITYFRRYALQSLLALEAEDDDGNSAVSGGVSDQLFGKLRNAYQEKKIMTPEMQEVYEKCSPEQKKRIGDITKDLRKNKDAKNPS